MHPIFEEICRANPGSIRPEVFRRWQRLIRDDLAAKVDAYDTLVVENLDLKTKLEKVAAKKPKGAPVV